VVEKQTLAEDSPGGQADTGRGEAADHHDVPARGRGGAYCRLDGAVAVDRTELMSAGRAVEPGEEQVEGGAREVWPPCEPLPLM
jgi:hypothetical protein